MKIILAERSDNDLVVTDAVGTLLEKQGLVTRCGCTKKCRSYWPMVPLEQVRYAITTVPGSSFEAELLAAFGSVT